MTVTSITEKLVSRVTDSILANERKLSNLLFQTSGEEAGDEPYISPGVQFPAGKAHVDVWIDKYYLELGVEAKVVVQTSQDGKSWANRVHITAARTETGVNVNQIPGPLDSPGRRFASVAFEAPEGNDTGQLQVRIIVEVPKGKSMINAGIEHR